MGRCNAAQIVGSVIRLMPLKRISIFPLPGAILLPGMHLPFHIFEPRYRALVSDSLARDRLIGMVQPKDNRQVPELFGVGCLGRISDVEALDDGCYNIVLEGLERFTIVEELLVKSEFRQVEGELWDESNCDEALSSIERAAIEQEARRYADAQGYHVDWEAVGQLDDIMLVNAIAQIAPFDGAAKQALLEARKLSDRSELVIQLMQFFARRDIGENRVTLQ
jgi:uncharacterized protein